jgi:hypothetical protein
VDWSRYQPGLISPVTRVRIPPPRPIGCRSTAGRCPVKAAIGVRIPAPERKVQGDVAQPVSALPCQGRGYGFESRRHRERIAQVPVVKRRSFQTTNLASQVRILPGIPTTWKLRIPWKLFILTGGFVSAGCKVSTLMAATSGRPTSIQARGPQGHHASLKLTALDDTT